ERERAREPVALGEKGAPPHDRAEELVEALARLEVAQVRRVGRGDVQSHIARARIHGVETGDVVIGGTVDGRTEVLADVDAEQAAKARLLDVRKEALEAAVVEAEAVDERLAFDQAKEARPGVARLRARRHRADRDRAG